MPSEAASPVHARGIGTARRNGNMWNILLAARLKRKPASAFATGGRIDGTSFADAWSPSRTAHVAAGRRRWRRPI